MDNVAVWGSLLLMAAGLGFVLFLIKLTVPRIFRNVLDHYGRRLELAEQIMNTRRAPREWVVKPLAQLETEDDPARRARIQARAARLCIRRLQAVIKFMRQANAFDAPDTKRTVLAALRRILKAWEADGWEALEPDPHYVLLRDRRPEDPAPGGAARSD